MISLVQALNFRCLRYVRQPLNAFHVLVGPNASGKTTFLDVPAFLGHLVSEGLDAAVEERSRNFHDLVWGRKGQRFELAVEATIPEEHQPPRDSPDYDSIRYEVAVGIDDKTDELRIIDEQVLLGSWVSEERMKQDISTTPPKTIFVGEENRYWHSLIHRSRKDELTVSLEQRVDENGEPGGDRYRIVTRSTPKKAIFDQLSEDEFPASTWLADHLTKGIHKVELDSRKLRLPSPPGKGMFLAADGSNLPWVVTNLQEQKSTLPCDWLAHLRTALPDLDGIRVVERPEDRHRYLMLTYKDGLEVPSWMLSDGTLRLLALTILAYVPGPKPMCLIEEPENSIHPLNIETVMQSLRSMYEGQVLVATHSPTVLAVTEAADVLVFARDETHGTSITRGDKHPALQEWRGEVSLGTLFAGGVLG